MCLIQALHQVAACASLLASGPGRRHATTDCPPASPDLRRPPGLLFSLLLLRSATSSRSPGRGRRVRMPLGANVPRRRPSADASSLISHPRPSAPGVAGCAAVVQAQSGVRFWASPRSEPRYGRPLFGAKSRRRHPPQAEAGGHSPRRAAGRTGARQVAARPAIKPSRRPSSRESGGESFLVRFPCREPSGSALSVTFPGPQPPESRPASLPVPGAAAKMRLRPGRAPARCR